MLRYRDERFHIVTGMGASQEILNSRILRLQEDRAGSLLVGTNNHGLHRVEDDALDSFTTLHGLSDDRVRCMYQDRNGNLWVGTYKGLNSLRDGPVSQYTRLQGPMM